MIRRGERDAPCVLTVCRGCCCGNPHKHPGVDHRRHLEMLREAAAASEGRLVVRTSTCLGACEQGNVIVVGAGGESRRHGGRTTWLGWTHSDEALEDVLNWVASGGPGLAALPATLELHVIRGHWDRWRRARRRFGRP